MSASPNPPEKHYAGGDFVYSYHPDGTFLMFNIDAAHTPAGLTIDDLLAVALAFNGIG
jgi:hypothetical protein